MINISHLVDSQLPDFFRQEYPTFVEFFKQYYKSQEIDGFSVNLLRKIQSYQDCDFYKDGLILETTLRTDLGASDNVINLSNLLDQNDQAIWKRFPQEGLLLLDDGTNREIVQYKEITSAGVVGSIQRGASGRVTLGDLLGDGEFISSEAYAFGKDTTSVVNITHLFLANLFKSLKSQYFSGIPIERLNSDISVPTILKYIKDFYTSKGTSPAIEFIFRSAFNDEKVLVRYPNEQLLKASISTWSEDTILQGSLIKFSSGVSIDDMPGLVLKQITYGFDNTIKEATASIEKVVPIKSGNETIYRIFLNNESIIGSFLPANKTVSRTTFGSNDESLIVDSTIGFPEINGEFYIESVNDVLGNPISFSYKEKSASEFYGIRTSNVFTGVGKNKAIFGSNILYVVSSTDTNPITDYFYASFRPSGLVSDIEIEGSGLFVKEGDVLKFGLSGKSPDSALTSKWRQNIPGDDSQVKQVKVAGSMNAAYLQGDYKVANAVNQVFENDEAVYVSSNGFPDTTASIGNINGSGPNTNLEPASQRHLKKIPKTPVFGESKTKLPDDVTIAVAIDGVPIISPTGSGTSNTDRQLVEQGDIQEIVVTNSGSGYTSPPVVTISGVGGAYATANISGGKVTSITLQNSGQGYLETPEVSISSGQGAILVAEFDSTDKTGYIQSLSITSGGSNYTQVPDIVIVDESGRGRGAKFVVEAIDQTNGQITAIRKVSSGFDYSKTQTKVYVVPSSSGASAVAKVRQWHRDNYESYGQYSDDQNGYVFPGRIPEYHDAYYYVGNPVGIRETLSDNILSGTESTSNLSHSPIVAWSYDGVPIYGPVGYTNPLDETSSLKRLESSYYLKSSRGGSGPTIGSYPLGSFVEDYEYKPEGDTLHKDLDEYNGRFCKTPDFPNGRYCYFLTIHQSDDIRKLDRQSVKPRYPYMIGPSYRYSPETVNFTTNSTIKNLPSDVIRIRDNSNNIPQFGSVVNAEVIKVSSGSVDSTIIENGGENYTLSNQQISPKFAAGDQLYVDDTNTEGVGFAGEVSSVLPKDSSGNLINVSSISASDITGNLDSRIQTLTISPPSYDVPTSTLSYTKINEGDTIQDSSRTSHTLITAIDTSLSDNSILLKENNISNLSQGDTLSVEDEVMYVNGAITNNSKYVYLQVSNIYATSPITVATDQGFYYQYSKGKDVFDSIYVDSGQVSTKIAEIIGIDYQTNTLKIKMMLQPGTSNYYSIPNVGVALSNAPQTDPRYTQNVVSVSYVKEVPVIRGFDGTDSVFHKSDLKIETQTPSGKISDYRTRLFVTSAAMDSFTIGVSVKGSASGTTARIVDIDTLTSTTGYLWVKDIQQGPGASDVPRFGTFDINTGTWSPETIREIGSGNTTSLVGNVSLTQTVITLANSDFFPINRYITIGTESMRIVSKSGNNITVTRAQLGTVASTHQEGVNVSVINAQGTYDSDTYYVTVDIDNHQKFTTSSTFDDKNDQSISVLTAQNASITSLAKSLYIKPNNIKFFNAGNIFKVGNENIRIDGIDANIFNVTRGFGGTTAAEHAENAQIINISELVATLSTDRPHGLIEGDFVEVFGDPSTENPQSTTNITVTFISGSNRFGFTSVHTENTIQQNPDLTFVYGHKYVFDVSDSSNANTILAFFLDDSYTNSLSVERNGLPGSAGATIIVNVIDQSIINLYYNNSNSLITDSSPSIRFIEDPYNSGGSPIFNIQNTSFDYIIRNRVEGNARGSKKFGVNTPSAFGEIAKVSITNRGFGYKSLPQVKGVYFRESDRVKYNVVVDNFGRITNVIVNFGGRRYVNPKIYVVGSGSGAVLVPEVDVLNGNVQNVSVSSSGSGYGTNTELIFLEEDTNNVRILPSSSTIGKTLGIRISNPGSRFTNNKTMTPETTIPVSMQLINVGKDSSGNFQSTIGTKYEIGETVYQGNVNSRTAYGTVVDYNEINQTIRVNPVIGIFETGKTLYGYLTATQSIPQTVNRPSISAQINAITQISGFFSDDLGKLSTSSQKIQDSYFYQDFSYVIRSQIPVSEWREIIKESTHPAGFLVFGEVIVDSSASVSTVPMGGSTTCPPRKHLFNFDSRTEIDSDGYIFIRNGQNIKVGDSFRYYQEGSFEIEWQATNKLGELVTGILINNKIYHVVAVKDNVNGKFIAISDYHPNDKFADADHNRERLTYEIVPTTISYFPEIICDAQNPYKQITIEIYKEFIDIDPTTPAKISENGNLKTLIINKFFRMVEKPGAGSVISAEGTVAINLSFLDDITPLIDNVNKIYDIRDQGSPIQPYSDYNLIVTLDGVAQEPGTAYTIINDTKIQSLEIAAANDGELEFDSWYISGTTTDLDDGTTTVSGQADVQETYKDEEFIYIKGRGIPSYQASFGPYSGFNPTFSDYIKRIPVKTFAPIDKEDTPLGPIGLWSNGVLLYNGKLSQSYNNKNVWIVNEPGSSPSTDSYGGKSSQTGNYYHMANPIGLRRQLGDNISSSGVYAEDAATPSHSPILGWAFDGTPIYGPYGYTDAYSSTSAIKKIDSGYQERSISTRNVKSDGTILSVDEVGPPVNSVEFVVLNFVSFTGSTDIFTNTQICTQVTSDTDDTIVSGVNALVETYDPISRTLLLSSVNGSFSQNMWIKTPTAWAQIVTTPKIYSIGYFTEDFEYTGTGDLDEYNGRFCVTPEFPEGRYCYFATIKSSTYDYSTGSVEENSAYPYVIGQKLYHTFYPENQLSKSDLSQKIIFAQPPKEFIDPVTGHTQTAKFVGRSFGFSDANNNRDYSKKFADISSQFDNSKTTFQLEYINKQPNYAPNDPLEPNETALVFIDGVIQIPGYSYTIDDTTNQITFSSPPRRIGKIINISEVSDILNYYDNEIITGGTSNATGKIISRTAVGYEGKGVLKVEVLTKDFQSGETITGTTSQQTSTIKLLGNISQPDRFIDASNLIEVNKNFIANEAVERMLANNPSFTVPGGSQNCIDDVVDVLGAVVDVLRYGGNAPAWDAANLYVNGGALQHLVGEEAESIETFNNARDIAIAVMQNQTITVQGSHGLSQYFDNTIAIDAATNSYVGSCANVESAIASSIGIITTVINNPSYLSTLSRNPGKSYVEKGGQFQQFFAYSNGKYTVLDAMDTSSPTTTFIMRSNGSLVIPNQSAQLIVVVNGVIQEFGKSYVINESLLEFYNPILAGSELYAFYWYGKDLEKVLQSYNVPLYDPSYVQYDDNGNEIHYVLDDNTQTNKRLRSLPNAYYPIREYFRNDDKIQIEGEGSSRELIDISNRDLIEWEHLDTYNDYFIDGSNVGSSLSFTGEPNKIYFEDYSTQSTSGFISGTKLVYTNEGNADIPGLVSGNTYYLGYSFRDKGTFLYDNYYDSLSAPPQQALTLGTSTGVHKFRIDTAITGLTQGQFKTSDYSGVTRGREAAFTARVRFTMTLSDSTNYPVGTLVFSSGESVGTVISDLGSNKVEFQILPDRVIPNGATVSTDLGGSNSVTVVTKENGRIHSIESLTGFFPTGLDYDTAPILVIKPAATDTGVFARAHAEIDQNRQIARCVVDYEGRDYFQVPDVVVTRAYKVINSVYPLVTVRNQYNFWTTVDTVLETVMVLEAQQFTVSSFLQGTTTVTRSGQEITLITQHEHQDGIDEDVSREYDYLQADPQYPKDSALAEPNIISVGRIRAYPTFQALETNKFNVDTTMSIADLSKAFADLKIEDISDRYFSSLYRPDNSTSTIRFNITPCTTIKEFGGLLSFAASPGDTALSVQNVQGFNYMIVEGNTFWLRPEMEIYEERSLVVKGYVDSIIDTDTFVLRLNRGQNLASGTAISNVANTVKVSIASQVYGLVEFGNETIAYEQLDWGANRIILSGSCTYAHAQGDYLRTTRPVRLDI